MDRFVMHVGTMKSGTTYLQGALTGGHAELDSAGAFFVGETWAEFHLAVLGMLRPERGYDPSAWEAMMARAAKRPGVGIASHEFLGFARAEALSAVLRPVPAVPIDVVLTVRDQHRAVPAQWQSYTRNLGTGDWATYLRHIEPVGTGDVPASPSMALRKFRRAQNVPAQIRRWVQRPRVRSVIVVTVPTSGSDPAELWHRFAQGTRLDLPVPEAASSPANESLGYASCDLLRRLNAHLNVLDKLDYRRARDQVVHALLPLRDQEGRPRIDRPGADLADRLNTRIRDAIEQYDVELVGSLDDLPVGADPQNLPDRAPDPEPAEVDRAASAVWRAIVGTSTPPPSDLDELVRTVALTLVRGRASTGPGPIRC